MLKQVRQNVVSTLWNTYRQATPEIDQIEMALKKRNVTKLTLDHFAIIDLPGPHSGIPCLSDIFKNLGYHVQGQDYLPEKQNPFLWLTEADSKKAPAQDVLPQIVVADFRLSELPLEIRNIIEKYASKTKPFALSDMKKLRERVLAQDKEAAQQLTALITAYLTGRDWPLPTKKEFHTVQAFNELLAWVLIFGRKPNHFTLSVHLLNHFADLCDFHRFIEQESGLMLNKEGGVIKGGEKAGIAQGSTKGIPQRVELQDGWIELPAAFMEFVWRYPLKDVTAPFFWEDYFTGFIAKHADHVIESLYGEE